MDLSGINNVSESEAADALQKCCGAQRWVKQMLKARPFKSMDDLCEKSAGVWQSLEERDWREAFTHHPKIGDVETLRKKFNTGAQWEAGEQSGAAGASEDVLKALAKDNDLYEKKFGYIFIVCATGKSADEMLAILQKRLDNQPGDEIKIAAGEQEKITRLRLEKLCQ